ncbi:MAG TPA: hypothetical protein VD930_10955, partial [Gemmatimonadales bacterium]|nr:hypothetical protein [Gemmatimonadales bacterium]
MPRPLGRLTLLVVLVACGDAAEPGTRPVASVAIVSGDLQAGSPGEELADPLVVRVRDAEGNPVRGQIVNFR